MPRDASDTRARLLREAERLFASRGVHQATTKEITEAAGQRNASALSYHFGSKDAVLWAILAKRGDPIDEHRGALLKPEMDTRDLVAALLIPYSRPLQTEEGRDYLMIVAQLTRLISQWRTGPLAPPNLRRILSALEDRVPAGPEIREQRVVTAAGVITMAMAERAREADKLDDDAFLANLADMLVGAIEAPAGAPLAVNSMAV